MNTTHKQTLRGSVLSVMSSTWPWMSAASVRSHLDTPPPLNDVADALCGLSRDGILETAIVDDETVFRLAL